MPSFLPQISPQKPTEPAPKPLVPTTSLYDIPTHSATKNWTPHLCEVQFFTDGFLIEWYHAGIALVKNDCCAGEFPSL